LYWNYVLNDIIIQPCDVIHFNSGEIIMYRHKQTGWVIIISLIFGVALTGYVYTMGMDTPGQWVAIGIGVLIALCIPIFYSITVTVDEKEVTAVFGIGLIKKKIPIDTIENVEAARNKWYYGWGIRYVLFQNTWMYNCSGLDAVQLYFKDGKKFRIGTDEPDKLINAIKSRIQ
jgi:prepilin signal peptidase PulO-like enzyme (type II secretory pathway)